MRSELNHEKDIKVLESYCFGRGLIKRKSHLPAFLKKVQAPFKSIFQSDGYTQVQAAAKLNKCFAEAATMLAGCRNQQQLEERIKDSTIYNPNLMGPADAITSLPGWMVLSPFDFDVRKWMLAALVPEGDWERTKHTLRYLPLWDGKVSRDERTYIFRRLMETDGSIASHALALYAKQILPRLADDPNLLDEVFGFIEKKSDVLPVLSAVPLSQVPEKFQKYVTPFLTLDDKTIHSDNIIPVRHVDNYAGTCAWMRQSHYETLMEGDQDTLGNLTLLYVDNQLVGSMKMYRNRSIVGLRTVQDSEGRHPVVASGVYVTTSEITRQAETAFEEQGKWAKLYLDRLPLFPINFLAFEYGFDETIRHDVAALVDVREKLEK